MSEPSAADAGRAARVARYKEERRRQLVQQFGAPDSPRITKTSRLRAQAALHENGAALGPVQVHRVDNGEKSCMAGSAGTIDGRNGGVLKRRPERDKSNKRKSNLNRALNSEPVQDQQETEDDLAKHRRHARRLDTPQSIKSASSNGDGTKSDHTNSSQSSLGTPSSTVSSTQVKPSPRKSELSIHMENARRGVTASYSEMNKTKTPSTKRSTMTSREKRDNTLDQESTSSNSDKDHHVNPKTYMKNVKKPSNTERRVSSGKSRVSGAGDRDDATVHRSVSKRMEELTALTKETLNRVERLTTKARESPRKDYAKRQVNGSVTSGGGTVKAVSVEKSKPSSILKKKSFDHTFDEPPLVLPAIEPMPSATPVSILKRKVSQDEHGRCEGSSTNTPPVTFSPSVIEPVTTNRKKQGILKKRRSLDESQVMRHRSCSPDVAAKSDSKSILKHQRRSSLEELTRVGSPDIPLQGILKRKSSKYDDDDVSLSSPQSILKRRSGASSAGSTGNSPHVSITTAVILAAAEGAEMILEPQNEFKPILKKKSFSEEYPLYDYPPEVPKPILKKKSSTDTDEYEDRPMKPILKFPRRSIDRESIETSSPSESRLKYACCDNDGGDMRPILKQGNPREDSTRPRLSFCEIKSPDKGNSISKQKRRSHTICSEVFDYKSDGTRNDAGDSRPVSVSELVMNFEKTSISPATGAIPKRSSLKRNSDRYRTQPITSNELEESLHLVRDSQQFSEISVKRPQSAAPLGGPLEWSNASGHSLIDFTSSLEDDSHLSYLLTTNLCNSSNNSSYNAGKMSSDSAFQSLGDGLELEDEDISPESSKISEKQMESKKLEVQMKAIAEEAKKMRLAKGSSGIQRYRNKKGPEIADRSSGGRYSTQPVTFEEVQEAAKAGNGSTDGDDEADPCNLSLSERIKLFNSRVAQPTFPKVVSPPPKRKARLTLPVTFFEVELARRRLPTTSYALDKVAEQRGNSKNDDSSPTQALPLSRKFYRKDSHDGSRVTDTPDITLDEGISCNDSASDSETSSAHLSAPSKKSFRNAEVRSSGLVRSASSRLERAAKWEKPRSDTSDGDSSGGREIRSIFAGEKQLKVKAALEAALSKSRSATCLRDKAAAGGSGDDGHGSGGGAEAAEDMPRAIAELQARLQEHSETEWRKRVPTQNAVDEIDRLLREKNKYNEELSERSILNAKKDELEAARRQWRERVAKSDAETFSVAGRMENAAVAANLSITALADGEKRKPHAKRFKAKDGNDSSSTPVSPEKCTHLDFRRTQSVCDPVEQETSGVKPKSSQKKAVLKPDDDTFTSFYKSEKAANEELPEHLDLSLDDLDAVSSQVHSLLVQKKNVQPLHRRRGTTRNPIKALATRTDLNNEYTEIITGAADREMKRLNIQKLTKTCTNNLAVEALAGLASNEDFKSVALKKSTGPTVLLPYKPLMLLQVKGRRYVQTRLVEPTVQSLNEGDIFILITPKALYSYKGAYSNIIEQSRATDVLNHIRQSADLGCKASEIITISQKSSDASSKQIRQFWELLGGSEEQVLAGAGHPDEDEVYESNILSTNMVYGVEGDELVPLEEYWGIIPKVEMLKPDRVFVFDFGSEMYIWSGKNAKIAQKRTALKLATELWNEGYNYSECNICPLSVSGVLGDRKETPKPDLKGGQRPDWSLFCKLTQHRETILFKEKFFDWPDFSRIIKVKSDDTEKQIDASYDLKPCDIEEMVAAVHPDPDVVVEGTHLGRGDQYFDEETRRLFVYDTLDITEWLTLENGVEKLPKKSIGHFFDCDSYILRWNFRMTVKGRELGGQPSKHSQVGRERSIYFFWQGVNSSVCEKGLSALLTVELDSESAPQIQVAQGFEPAAFLKLFKGKMAVHKGKRDTPKESMLSKLYIVRNEMEDEVCLLEVSCQWSSLRSRTSFILVDPVSSQLTVWHGAKSSVQSRKVALAAARKIADDKAEEYNLQDAFRVEVTEAEEDCEEVEFSDKLEGTKDSYVSLAKTDVESDYTLRLFHLTSLYGKFECDEVLCPHRSEFCTPYPFLQDELYSASQPALYLIDNRHELWLWQGFWPEKDEDSETELCDQTGSGAVRWQAERKAAMQTAERYWKRRHPDSTELPIYLVWAGLEPLEFTNLFPTWSDRKDIAELNIKEGKVPGEKRALEKELARLSRTTYPLDDLLKRPLPEGVDPTQIEIYLSSEDFQELLSMSKEEFQKLPLWRKTSLKKEKGLF